jgi:hypothetical protein
VPGLCDAAYNARAHLLSLRPPPWKRSLANQLPMTQRRWARSCSSASFLQHLASSSVRRAQAAAGAPWSATPELHSGVVGLALLDLHGQLDARASVEHRTQSPIRIQGIAVHETKTTCAACPPRLPCQFTQVRPRLVSPCFRPVALPHAPHHAARPDAQLSSDEPPPTHHPQAHCLCRQVRVPARHRRTRSKWPFERRRSKPGGGIAPFFSMAHRAVPGLKLRTSEHARQEPVNVTCVPVVPMLVVCLRGTSVGDFQHPGVSCEPARSNGAWHWTDPPGLCWRF